MFDWVLRLLNPLSANLTKMVKHTQTIRRQKPTNCLNVFDHLVGLALRGLTIEIFTIKLRVKQIIAIFTRVTFLISFDHPLCSLKPILSLMMPPHNISKSVIFSFTFGLVNSLRNTIICFQILLLVFSCLQSFNSPRFSVTRLLTPSCFSMSSWVFLSFKSPFCSQELIQGKKLLLVSSWAPRFPTA